MKKSITMAVLVSASLTRPPIASGDVVFWRGDTNEDSALNIGDGITVLSYLFANGPLECLDAGDTNDSGQLDIADGVYLLNYLFAEGPPPPAPFGACGADPTPDALGCASFAACPQNREPTASFTADPVTGDAPLEVAFDGSASDDPDGTIASWAWDFGDGESGSGERTSHTYASPASYTVTLTVTDDGGATDSATLQISVTGEGPPIDPGRVAPPLDRTATTPFHEATSFLYAGDNPIQSGVEDGAIVPRQAAVLRGRVLSRDGEPLSMACVRVAGHPEFGETRTRADGLFDLAVSGGGRLTLSYEREGHVTVQRTAYVPWQDYVWVPDVVLTPRDSAVTEVAVSETAPQQVARGSVVSDERGDRQATLLFRQGTAAEIVLPDGSTQSVDALHVRATEFTVGPEGPLAMPGELPPRTAYTYAVEFSADEAEAAGAKDIRFSRGVVTYIENFPGLPAGVPVPSYYWDREKGIWVDSADGRVIAVLDIADDLAVLDTDGNGSADAASVLEALGIDDAERREIAALYAPGRTLWRVVVTHFTPWDFNFDPSFPEDAEGPDMSVDDEEIQDQYCEEAGSIIEGQNQVLGTSVAIAGTPFTLNYRSLRTPGRKSAYTVSIRLGGASVPGSLLGIDLHIYVAGQHIHEEFPPNPNLAYTFTWDGKDAYGREVQGEALITIRVGYRYELCYRLTSSVWCSPSPIIAWKWAEWKGSIGTWDARAAGLGGWTLDVHHAYDPAGRVLHLGGGDRRSGASQRPVMTTVAGTGEPGFSGDGGPATEARFDHPSGIAVASDGTLFISDTYNNRVRRVDPAGTITTITGTGGGRYSGDGGPAIEAGLYFPRGVDVGPDGSLYIADTSNKRLRYVDPAGTIQSLFHHATTTGVYGVSLAPDGGLFFTYKWRHAVTRRDPNGSLTGLGYLSASFPYGCAAGLDGEVYVVDESDRSSYAYRFDASGEMTVLAGTGSGGNTGDGGPAEFAQLNRPRGIAVSPGGIIYIADYGNHSIRRIGPDGIITTVAGTGTLGFNGDGRPATDARLQYPVDVVVGPDGSLYIVDSGNYRIRRVAPALPGFTLEDIVIGSERGTAAFVFDAVGRHLRTVATLEGVDLLRFDYDEAGRLTRIEDQDGNATAIERDGDGTPVAILSPLGLRTEFDLDANGYLAAITDPTGAVTRFTYSEDGLLQERADPEGNTSMYTYDDLGRLTRAEDPAGGFQTFERRSFEGGYEVTRTTALGRVATYRVEDLPEGETRFTTSTCCEAHETTFYPNGNTEISAADGMRTTRRVSPDPRFGMDSPVTRFLEIKTAGERTLTAGIQRSITPPDDGDPLAVRELSETFTINGRECGFTFEAATGDLTATSPEGRTVRAALDDAGRLLRWQYADRTRKAYGYDDRGRLISIVLSPDRIHEIAYDASGFPNEMIDPLGRTWRLEYDASGRMTGASLPGGREIRCARDRNGNPTSITPPGRPAHRFAYTPRGDIAQEIPPEIDGESHTTRYEYDTEGRIARIVRPDGATVEYAYDEAGRLETITTPRGATTFTREAGTGQLTAIATPEGNGLGFTYDSLLPLSTLWSGEVSGTVAHTHDNDFLVASQSVNGAHEVSFAYDGDGLIIGAGDLTLTRDPVNGSIAANTLGAIADTYAYNALGELERHTTSHGETVLLDIQYAHDSGGRIVEKTETVGGTTSTWTYAYDEAGRLAEVQRDGVRVEAYSYDPNGNRIGFEGGAGSVAATYDEQDRLVTYGDVSYSFHPNGELAERTDTAASETTTYRYDAMGNLTGATLPDGTEIAYVIDGLGNRIAERVDGALMRGFLYDESGQIVAELDGAGSVVARFVYGARGTGPEYLVKAGRTYRIVTDHLGSPRLVVDAADGTVAHALEYDAFGRIVKDTNPGFQPFGFAGGLLDPHTGVYHFGARDYDPQTGRWTSKDPLGFLGGDLNLYAYVRDDPVNRVDPDGLQAISLPDPELGPDSPILSTIDLGNPPQGWEEDDLIYTQLAGTRCISHCKSRARMIRIKWNKLRPGLPRGTSKKVRCPEKLFYQLCMEKCNAGHTVIITRERRWYEEVKHWLRQGWGAIELFFGDEDARWPQPTTNGFSGTRG
ncbi:MAG: PKD domain-containing protein [Planctomycetes bacterium]|nr:PKD domain-containing protein [Planctomycetota bacterium]